MRVEGGSDNPANSVFTFPEIDEVGRHPVGGAARQARDRRAARHVATAGSERRAGAARRDGAPTPMRGVALPSAGSPSVRPPAQGRSIASSRP
jgi:hypothetical protein